MAILTAKEALQTEVRAAILPHSALNKEPPYSPTELITMALVVHDKPMEISDIIEWIAVTFVHYATVSDLYDDELLDYRRTETGQRAIALRDRLLSGLYALPLPADTTSAKTWTNQRWRVRWDEARCHLQRALGFQLQGTFPFLDLPPELRHSIYEIVFRYPVSGVSPVEDAETAEKTTIVIHKDSTAPFDFSEWNQAQPSKPNPKPYFTEPINQTLSLLLVNKQIFKEAMPYFYQNNLFYFLDTAQLFHFLRNTPAYRRQHLTQLAIDYPGLGTDYHYAPAAFRILATNPSLKRLFIHHDEDHYGSLDLSKVYVMQSPGATTLKQISGLQEVVFSGKCEVFRGILKPLMERPISKKRKDMAVEVEDWARPKRAVRARKAQKKT